MIDARFGRLTDAPASFTLVGARVIDPANGTDAIRDLVVHDGVIAATNGAAEVIDARGLVVSPGFCDLHVHFREPGDPAAETIETGARAAARGGYTTVCAMPNTDPPIDTGPSVAAAARDASCRVRVIGAATRARDGHDAADLASMAAAGAVGFSDDGAAIPHGDLVRHVMGVAAGLGLPIVEHAEDAVLAGGGVMRAGSWATRLGLAGWSPDAEGVIVERDIAIAAETGVRLHLTHLSTSAGLAAVRAAKSRGLPVTCDVTPHHFALTDAWVGGSRAFAWDEAVMDEALAYDGTCRVNPPLASRDDALALLDGIADGTVDAIATDHAPHPQERKLVPFDEAAPGLVGLETALSLGLAAIEAGQLGMPALIAALSTRPAAIIGEARGLSVGSAADLVLFDPHARWRVEAASLTSTSANTPLLGMELPGVVRLTVAGGRLTYRS